LKIGVVGIPKRIDNDIHLIDRSFGFDTAVDVVVNVIRSAHNEAVSASNGIGLVKLMGRHSGFIAAAATLAMPEVNFCLIPEADFEAITLKYIDPSYTIRGAPANANDHVLCGFLGRSAVHAGMAGKTRMLVGLCNNHFVHIPIEATVGKRKHVKLSGDMWTSVLETTGQTSLKH
jgi:6-phosphofructokinase